MNTRKTAGVLARVALGWLVVFAFRLIPGRLPNIEGVMGTLMPVSKRFNAFGSFLYGASALALYDVFTNRIGIWTLVTALAYGAIGAWSYSYFKSREANRKNFVVFSIYGTLAFDIVTGFFIGPLFFGQPFIGAVIGQIPFTMYHLAGNITIAVLVSPLFLKYIVTNPAFERSHLLVPSSVK